MVRLGHQPRAGQGRSHWVNSFLFSCVGWSWARWVVAPRASSNHQFGYKWDVNWPRPVTTTGLITMILLSMMRWWREEMGWGEERRWGEETIRDRCSSEGFLVESLWIFEIISHGGFSGREVDSNPQHQDSNSNMPSVLLFSIIC